MAFFPGGFALAMLLKGCKTDETKRATSTEVELENVMPGFPSGLLIYKQAQGSKERYFGRCGG
jgi:hypothetical protein